MNTATNNRLALEVETGWEIPEQIGEAQDLETEKRIRYSASLFHLIERCCAEYESIGTREADPAEAQRLLLSIRETAELGRGLCIT